MEIIPLLPIVIGLIVVFVFLAYSFYIEKKRTENLKKLALRSGYEFFEKMELPSFGFEFFNQGHSRNAKNLIKYAGWEVFDYSYTVGGGKSRRTYNQTVAIKNVSLPHFILRSEKFFDKIADKIFTPTDIDFKDHPDFSKKYLLKGDEIRLRDLFKPNVLKFFEDKKEKPYIESSSGKFLICYKLVRKKPEEIRAFLEECEKTVELFK